MVGLKPGGAGASFADLLAGKQFDLKLDPEAPPQESGAYTIVGKSLAAARCAGQMHRQPRLYVHDFTVPGMLHGSA